MARHLAAHIPGARLTELPGNDHVTYVNGDQIIDEVEEFLPGPRHEVETDQVATELNAALAEFKRLAADGPTDEEFDAVATKLEAFIARHGHARVLEIVKETVELPFGADEQEDEEAASA